MRGLWCCVRLVFSDLGCATGAHAREESLCRYCTKTGSSCFSKAMPQVPVRFEWTALGEPRAVQGLFAATTQWLSIHT